jgi:hypothetical protein
MQLGRCPRRIAPFVASVAIGDCHPGERCIGNMRHRLAVSRRVRTAVAGSALVGYRHLRVIPLRWLPGAGAMATNAINRSGYVRSKLACRSAAVVAAGAVCGRCKQTMVWLGAQPGTGGFVAGFTHGLPCMNGSSGPTSQSIGSTHMASSTLPGYRH